MFGKGILGGKTLLEATERKLHYSGCKPRVILYTRLATITVHTTALHGEHCCSEGQEAACQVVLISSSFRIKNRSFLALLSSVEPNNDAVTRCNCKVFVPHRLTMNCKTQARGQFKN